MKNGLYRFDQFHAERMFGENGYYSSGNGVGADFDSLVTADPMLPIRIGQWLDKVWEQQGSPSTFAVYEIGSGNGDLCKKILALDLACSNAIQYTAVEYIEQYHANYPNNATVVSELSDQPISGAMFAIEFNTQHPIRFVSFKNDAWKELFINIDGNATYEWHDLAGEIPQSVETIKGLDGSAPIIVGAIDQWKKLTANFAGNLLMVDYGYTKTFMFPGMAWFKCVLNRRPTAALDLGISPLMACVLPVDQLEECLGEASVENYDSWISGKPQPFDGFLKLEWHFSNNRNIN